MEETRRAFFPKIHEHSSQGLSFGRRNIGERQRDGRVYRFPLSIAKMFEICKLFPRLKETSCFRNYLSFGHQWQFHVSFACYRLRNGARKRVRSTCFSQRCLLQPCARQLSPFVTPSSPPTNAEGAKGTFNLCVRRAL